MIHRLFRRQGWFAIVVVNRRLLFRVSFASFHTMRPDFDAGCFKANVTEATAPFQGFFSHLYRAIFPILEEQGPSEEG
jgi:hypothetical protein